MRTDTIPHLAETAALKWPDSPALIENGRQWTFAELWSEARAAIAACLAQGIGEGDRVAIWAPNSRLWVLAAIGAMGAGAAVVPLNTRYKGREAGDILRRTKARILFTVDDFLGTDYPALLAGEDLPDLERTLLLTDMAAGADNWPAFIAEGTAKADDVDAVLAGLTADHLSDILFTSG
ncbi:MAG: hypothetical protein RJB02_151, partial [Pseudomonadota bacterium]